MITIVLTFIVLFPVVLFLHQLDLSRARGKVHLFGIYGFFGLPGQGKTMCMCRQLSQMRKKYGDKIYIMTNFNYNDEDFQFKSWKDLLKEYDKPLIVAWDEVQMNLIPVTLKHFLLHFLHNLLKSERVMAYKFYIPLKGGIL